jgi:Signal transduction histidine kinase
VGIRPKLFLIFLLGLAPMLALGWLLYWNGVSSVETVLRADVERDAAGIARAVESTMRQREAGMIALARSQDLRNYVRVGEAKTGANESESVNRQPSSKGSTTATIPPEVRAEVRAVLLSKPKCYASIICLNAAHKPLFRAEPVVQADGETEVQFQTEVFLSSAVSNEKAVWETGTQMPVRANASSSSTMLYMIPVFTGEEGKPAPRGALIAELNGDELLGEAVVSQIEETQTNARLGDSAGPRFIVMLDRTGRILYHTQVTRWYQQVNSAMPAFASISSAMMAQESGEKFYDGEGSRWLVAYRPVTSSGLSVAVAGNYRAAVAGAQRLGWIAIILFAVFGLALAFVLTHVARGTARSIERVTEGAVAIAGGKLDQRIEVRSSDETRLLAESFNIMTDRLREQIARETESRQFESFMRLSAMLTHDLKNAIASLSLLVSNMQKQFHREEFREDAMKSLTEATNKLRSLVSKLSEPVQSLSSEHQLPRPTDLTKIIRRVLDATVEPVRTMHEIEIKLPDTLIATVEADRIEKVFENLVINALEAMGAKSGKLRVEAGPTAADSKVYFLVSDTGPGMSEEFKRTKLFRAFATTKRSGVGLGLYTCREIVRTHGGHIDVESKRGSGTTFRVVLPSEQKFMGRTSHELSKRQ